MCFQFLKGVIPMRFSIRVLWVAGMLFLIPLFAVIYRLLAEDTRRRNEMAQGDMPRG